MSSNFTCPPDLHLALISDADLNYWVTMDILCFCLSFGCLVHTFFIHRGETWRVGLGLAYPSVRFFGNIYSCTVIVMTVSEWWYWSVHRSLVCDDATYIVYRFIQQVFIAIIYSCELYLTFDRLQLLGSVVPPVVSVLHKRISFCYAATISTCQLM